jgi:hypothetical protein
LLAWCIGFHICKYNSFIRYCSVHSTGTDLFKKSPHFDFNKSNKYKKEANTGLVYTTSSITSTPSRDRAATPRVLSSATETLAVADRFQWQSQKQNVDGTNLLKSKQRYTHNL